METRFSRTRILVGEEGMRRLADAHAVVCGLGGVGSYAFEALVRAGVGQITVIDADVYEPSNLNRQLLATTDSLGRPKAEVAAERAAQINPDCRVDCVQDVITSGDAGALLPDDARFGVDAIDMLWSKASLVEEFHRRGLHFVSCLGAARRLDPSSVRTADLAEVSHCPLGRRLRGILRQRGIREGVRCVYSFEPPIGRPPSRASTAGDAPEGLGSISYLPALIGLTAAGHLVKDMLSPDDASRR
jgi:tRNA A37 threonylcarbamoyladenosine dehydratase